MINFVERKNENSRKFMADNTQNMTENTTPVAQAQAPVEVVENTPSNTPSNDAESEAKNSAENTPSTNLENTPFLEEILPQKRAGWYDALVILLLFNLAQVVGGALCGFLAPKIGMELPTEIMRESVDSEVVEYVRFLQSRMVAVSLFLGMIIGLPLVAWYTRLRGVKPSISFRRPGWATSFRLLCGYLLLWCITIAAEPLSEMLPGDQSMLGGGGWLLVSAVLLAPIFEEVVFRGYIAGLLKSAYGGLVAWLLSSLIFGVVHFYPSVILTATLSGLVLGFFYLRYRSLVMVILLHAMNNITACFLLTVDLNEVTLRDLVGEGTLYWCIYVGCVIISLLSLSRMAVVVSRIKRENIASKK